MSQILRAACAAAFLSLFSFTANADSITLLDCDADGCRGSTVSLDVELTGADTYTVTLSLDSTDYYGSRDGVNQAGFKAFSDYTSVSLLSAPDAGWSDPITAPINSNGDVCATDPSASGHVCTAGFTDVQDDDEYAWVFEVVGGTLLDPLDWHIGFQYADSAEPTRGQIISAAVPEPTAAFVFAAGLGTVGLRLRSVRRRS